MLFPPASWSFMGCCGSLDDSSSGMDIVPAQALAASGFSLLTCSLCWAPPRGSCPCVEALVQPLESLLVGRPGVWQRLKHHPACVGVARRILVPVGSMPSVRTLLATTDLLQHWSRQHTCFCRALASVCFQLLYRS